MQKEKTKKEILPETTFGEAISMNPKAAKVLAEEEMFCGCCPMAMMETIEQGAKAHGKDISKLLKKLNK
jgi:hybrid cluster-associated redox disulfide protein